MRFALNYRRNITLDHQNHQPDDISAVPDVRRVRWLISRQRWLPGATIDSWAPQTIVDPTADGCPRSPNVYHVPWVLYLHLVLLSKNIIPVSEFAVNPSRLPHRTVADRRRTAQRVQERFRTDRRRAQWRRLSASTIGSDHVNSDTVSTRTAAAAAYFLTISSTARVYIAHRKFFFSLAPTPTASPAPSPTDFLGRFRRFARYFYSARPLFAVPASIYHFAAAPQNQLSTSKPYPCGPRVPPMVSSAQFVRFCDALILLTPFSPVFYTFLYIFPLSLHYDSVHCLLVSSIFRIFLMPCTKNFALNHCSWILGLKIVDFRPS